MSPTGPGGVVEFSPYRSFNKHYRAIILPDPLVQFYGRHAAAAGKPDVVVRDLLCYCNWIFTTVFSDVVYSNPLASIAMPTG